MTPQRVQMTRKHPWRAQHPDAVIVARGHEWGNPYPVGAEMMTCKYGVSDLPPIVITRELAVALFRAWLLDRFGVGIYEHIRRELGGKDLACWCPLDQPCHADLLLEIANPAP